RVSSKARPESSPAANGNPESGSSAAWPGILDRTPSDKLRACANRVEESTYRINPSFRAWLSHKNKFRYGLWPELQSFHRLSQSGRRKSHMHSLSTLIGRDFLFRARLS